ncbi:MAG: beta-N-acetylhexosaminidase [Polyangiaceae bacterium]|nr:beta-N-acetylhexosaminidase [Polyangiaceae bacterium]MCW5791424.1 beta-N-acetylhexosaminidase [Polyangiaceae bacterium]
MSSHADNAGAVVLGGFSGTELPEEQRRALAAGRRAGFILFRRNLTDVQQAIELTTAITRAAPRGASPPLIALDQEGGRVRRLGAPLLELPPMRALGSLPAGELTDLAQAVGAELAACGFNLDFAPVLDVDSNPDNPVIGDRAFASTASVVARAGVAFAQGLALGGVHPVGKHFPGHGDTRSDSHFTLPYLASSRERLDALELTPFRAAIAAQLPCLMTAHVVFQALDRARPATLSPHIITGLLREELGYRGAVFSDCLEMEAIAREGEVAEAAVAAVAAGVDVVLICHRFDRQEAAVEALTRRAERDGAFATRLAKAADRSRGLAKARPPQPDLEALNTLLRAHQPLQASLERYTSAQHPAMTTERDPTER